MSIAFGNFFDPRVAARENSAQVEAQRENRSRTAFSTHSFQVSGVGTVLLGTVDFDFVFLDRPRVMMGASILQTPPLGTWGLPDVNGLVTKWVVDRKKHYTGAQVYAVTDIRRVDGEAPEAYPEFSAVLDVVFVGVAYKDLGTSVTVASEMLSPRPTGLGG